MHDKLKIDIINMALENHDILELLKDEDILSEEKHNYTHYIFRKEKVKKSN